MLCSIVILARNPYRGCCGLAGNAVVLGQGDLLLCTFGSCMLKEAVFLLQVHCIAVLARVSLGICLTAASGHATWIAH